MKKLKFALLSLITLSLTSCILPIKPIKRPVSLDVNLVEKSRKQNEIFDVSDVNVTLHYNDESIKEINYVNLEENDLIALFLYPGYDIHDEDAKFITPVDNFVMDEAGTWTLYVSHFNSDTYMLEGIYNSIEFEVISSYVKAESVTLSDLSLSLSLNETAPLSATVYPNNVSSGIVWSSSNNDVASIDNGVVTANDTGTCTISATIDDVVAECEVIVNPYEEITYEFKDFQFNTELGGWTYTKLGDRIDLSGGRGVQITGSTQITSPISFEKVSYVYLELFTEYSFVGFQNGQISVYTDDVLQYSQSLSERSMRYEGYVAMETVRGGNVSVKIDPPLGNGFFGVSSIYLKTVGIIYDNTKTYASSINLVGNDTVGMGANDKLTVDYLPHSCNQRNVIWDSSDNDILTISEDGTMTGVKEGKATITANVATEEGFVSAIKEIEVVSIPVTNIELGKPSFEVAINTSSKIRATITPSNASYKDLVYVSSDPNVATVDANGSVTGISLGNCTITVYSAKYPEIIASCDVTVVTEKPVTPTEMKYTTKDYTKNNTYYIDSAPTLGDTKLLVIPVWFTDSTKCIAESKKSSVKDDIYKTFFGTTSDTGWQSVSSYYGDLSDGALNLTGTVSDWYECGYSAETYAYYSGKYSYNSTDPTCKLINSAVSWYFSTYTSDSKSNYDVDHNGYLDGVVLIYGTNDYIQRGNENQSNLWAYTYWMQDISKKNASNPGVNTFLFASYDFMYSEGSDSHAHTGLTSYGSGDTSHCKLDAHTYIHEIGHVFGLDDYYDYSLNYNPAGSFSMQDTNVGSHDPFSVMAMGWGKTYIPENSCSLTLKPYQQDHEAILLTPEWNEFDSPFDEYLLVEFYTPTGLNEMDCNYAYGGNSVMGPKTYGIRLWHVDARLVEINDTRPGYSFVGYPTENCFYAMSNTYASDLILADNSHLSILGSNYYDFNLLQLIRNSTNEVYKPTHELYEISLFRDGDSFDMTRFRRQFKNSGKLNSGLTLGWSFSVDISGQGENSIATITLVKE